MKAEQCRDCQFSVLVGKNLKCAYTGQPEFLHLILRCPLFCVKCGEKKTVDEDGLCELCR